jgi:hypothetical protein
MTTNPDPKPSIPPIDFGKLSAPFPPDRVSWRVGSTTQDKQKGMALAYIDARDVMGRLDDVCGPGGWQCRYLAVGTKTSCEIGVRINYEWVWKADGAGDTDFEGDKGAFSDAFKRAAVKWGVGRYLYDVESPWVHVEPMGKSFRIKESEFARLRAMLGKVEPSVANPMPTISPAQAMREWVIKAEREIMALQNSKACDNWAMCNGRTLARLKAISEADYNFLMNKLTSQQAKWLAA